MPLAKAELAAAQAFLNHRKSGLGDDLVPRVDERLREVQSQPRRFPEIYRRVRRAQTIRFPYGIFYRILPDRIAVIAILDLRRDPVAIRGRLG
jgi:hypothetical protein